PTSGSLHAALSSLNDCPLTVAVAVTAGDRRLISQPPPAHRGPPRGAAVAVAVTAGDRRLISKPTRSHRGTRSDASMAAREYDPVQALPIHGFSLSIAEGATVGIGRTIA